MKIRLLLSFALLWSVAVSADEFETLPGLAANKYVFVSGSRVTLNHESFTNVNKNIKGANDKYVALVRVEGDPAGPLIFDVDATIKGSGFYDTGFRCYKYFRQPNGSVRIGAGLPPNCDSTSVNVDNKFYFSVRLNVTCNEMVVGTYTGNKNALITPSQVQTIENSIDRTYGWIIGNPYETKREISLLVNAERNTGGACKELRVELEGLQGTKLSEITSNVLIAEPF